MTVLEVVWALNHLRANQILWSAPWRDKTSQTGGSQMHHENPEAKDGLRAIVLSQHTNATSPCERLTGKIRVTIEAARSSKRHGCR